MLFDEHPRRLLGEIGVEHALSVVKFSIHLIGSFSNPSRRRSNRGATIN